MATILDMNSYLFGCIILCISNPVLSQENEEYCERDVLDFRCGAGEVVIIESAIYGAGRCLHHLKGRDCHVDVLDVVEKWCTGRPGCMQEVQDSLFEHDCEVDSGSILSLHVSYTCQPVLAIDRRDCDAPVSVPGTQGYVLLSSISMDTCAHSRTPLVLQAQSGQRFNLSLLDASGADPDQGACPIEIGSVKDLANGRRKAICGGKQRHVHLVLSNGNRLQLMVERGLRQAVLFQYQVLGCADMEPVEGSRLRRQDDMVEVECVESGRKWELVCQNNEWIGAKDDCDKGGPNVQHYKDGTSGPSVSRDVVVIVVGVVTLLASVAIVCTGIIQLVKTLPCQTHLRNKRNGYGLPSEQNSEEEIVYNDGGGLRSQPISQSFVQLHTVNRDRLEPATTPTPTVMAFPHPAAASPTVMTLNSQYENMSANSGSSAARGALYETLELQALEAQGIIRPGTSQQHSRQGSVVGIVPVPVANPNLAQPPLPTQAPKRQKSWAQTLKLRAQKPAKTSFRKSAPLPVPRVQSLAREGIVVQQAPRASNASLAHRRTPSSSTAPRRVPTPPSPEIAEPLPVPNPPQADGPPPTCQKMPTYSVPMRNSMIQSEMPDVVYQTTEASYVPRKEGEDIYEVPLQNRNDAKPPTGAKQNIPTGTHSSVRMTKAFAPSSPLPSPPEEEEYIYTDMTGGQSMKEQAKQSSQNKKPVPPPKPEIDPEVKQYASLDLSQPIRIPDYLQSPIMTQENNGPNNNMSASLNNPLQGSTCMEESLYANLAPPPPAPQGQNVEFDSSDYGALCDHSSNFRPEPEAEEEVYATAKEYYVLEQPQSG